MRHTQWAGVEACSINASYHFGLFSTIARAYEFGGAAASQLCPGNVSSHQFAIIPENGTMSSERRMPQYQASATQSPLSPPSLRSPSGIK